VPIRITSSFSGYIAQIKEGIQHIFMAGPADLPAKTSGTTSVVNSIRHFVRIPFRIISLPARNALFCICLYVQYVHFQDEGNYLPYPVS